MQLLRQRGVPARCTVCDQAELQMMSYYVGLVMTNSFTENIQVEGGMGDDLCSHGLSALWLHSAAQSPGTRCDAMNWHSSRLRQFGE
jgi:hypothetical protein